MTNPTGRAAVDQHHRADVALAHQLGDLAHRALGGGGDDGLGHDLADQHAASLQSRAVAQRTPAQLARQRRVESRDRARSPRSRPGPLRGRARVARRRAQRHRPEPPRRLGPCERRARIGARVTERQRTTAPSRICGSVAVADSTETAARLGGAPAAARRDRRDPRRPCCSAPTSAADLRGAPRSGLLEALRARSARPGRRARSVRDAFYVFYSDHAATVIAASVLRGDRLHRARRALSLPGRRGRARRRSCRRRRSACRSSAPSCWPSASLMGAFGERVRRVDVPRRPAHGRRRERRTGSSVLAASSFIGLVGQLALAAAFVLIASTRCAPGC